jgi:PAS domain S-box-containing protein
MTPTPKALKSNSVLFSILAVIMLGAVVGAGALYYGHQQREFTATALDQMETVADLKVAEIQRYIEERLADASLLQSNPGFAALTKRFLLERDPSSAAELEGWLRRFKEAYEYDSVMILDREFNKVLAVPSDLERSRSWVSQASLEVLGKNQPALEDFYLNEANQRIYLKVLVPIVGPSSQGSALLGAVAFRIDPGRFLYPLLHRWPGSSTTAETLLVRREGEEVLFLNELKFKSGTALKLRIPLSNSRSLAVQGVLGKEGPVEGLDYRGVPSLGVVRKVKHSPWVMVTRIDRAEIFSPLEGHLYLVMAVLLALMAALASLLGLVWRWRRADTIKEQLELERAYRKQEAVYRALFENVGVGVAHIAPDMTVLAVNRLMDQWFSGFPDPHRSLCFQLFNAQPREAICHGCPTALTLQDGLMHEGEVAKEWPEGTRYFRIISTPVRDQEGRLTGAIEMVDEVTERRQMEQALKENEARLRAVTDSAGEAIVMINTEGLVTFWNPAAEAIFGYSDREMLGSNLHAIITPERFREAHLLAFEQFGRTGTGAAIGKTLELPARHRSGKEIDVLLSLSAIQINGCWHAVGILRDITVQKAEAEQLRLTMERLAQTNQALEVSMAQTSKMAFEAQAANIAKGQFLANMSHEIRTPMNGVIGMTGLLLDTPMNPEQRRFAEVIRNSGEALMSVINDILDFSKIEADKLDLEELDFNLRATLEDAAELLAVKAHEKRLEFTVQIDPELRTFLRGDPGRLRQVLMNLAGNAIKFTAHGEVGIRALLVQEDEQTVRVRFEVRDTGIGIPEDKFGLLFNAFEQLDASTTRRFGGTGLGLAICKRLVEKMGGEIGVLSELGCGSTFWFTVSLGKAQLPEESEEQIRAEISNARVLVVDDNATNRFVVSSQLASWGVPHQLAEGATQALALLREAAASGQPFQVVLTDMQMPEIDGETLGTMIKGDPALRATVMIMMTSLGRRGDAKRLRQAGFAGYLTKPVKQSQLFDCLATALVGGADAAEVDREPTFITRHSLAEDRLKRVRILLAEDNPTNQQVALQVLAKMGFKAEAVGNGMEALEALARGPFDLVLMDIQMPVLDGLEATRAIRSGKHGKVNPLVPIIAMTAHTMKGDREKCLEAGMDDYVSKPISPVELARALENWLGREHEGTPGVAPPTEPQSETIVAPVFDRAALLARLMGDEELAGQILGGFLADMVQQLSELRRAAAEEALEGLVRRAHTVKGAAANVGGMALSAAALELEQAAREGRRPELEALVAAVVQQFTVLQTKIQEVGP